MRLRIAMLACALSALVAALGASAASAAPHHNRGLSIRAVPHQIIAGESVLIYGRLSGADHGNQVIRLYHRIAPNRGYSLIGVTKTDSQGLYEFTRAEGIVETNRSWFVRGPAFTHSRTVYERVSALVSLAASATSSETRHPVVFSGHVTPSHAGNRVLLQYNTVGDDWHTLKAGRIGPDSNFSITAAFRTPGERNLRVLLPRDARNVASASDPVSVLTQQTEHGDFTINTTDPIVPNASPYTISGTLYQPGTTTPEPGTSVSLFAHEPGMRGARLVTTATTDSAGNYAFADLTSTVNQLYQVRTTYGPRRDGSAILFQGVQDVVNMNPSSGSSSTVGGRITFTGNVAPDKSGHVIYLQRLGADGDWHTVEVRIVRPGSVFSFGWTFGTAGTKQFRARIFGGPANLGAASAPVTVQVTQPPVTSLPSAG